MNEKLKKFFDPKSVVVIGASNAPFNLGATICDALARYYNFSGPVYAVNRKGETVHGAQGFTSVTGLPEAVDLAIVLTPARVVPRFIEECGTKGIQSVIIESAGFSEEGEEGKKYQEEINQSAAKHGIRIMGPNCLGTLDTRANFCCFYGADDTSVSSMAPLFETPGTVSYIIQSGGVGVLIMESLVNDVVGLNRMVSIGNKSDVDEADILELFNEDDTEVIGMYLENLADGRRFMEAAAPIKKPILVFKVGRTEAGAKAAMSHTAGMANNDDIFNAACRQTGVIRCRTIDELHSLPKIFTEMPPLKGKNIALFTNSGAFGGITSDILVEEGLSVARLKDETRERLSKTGQVFNAGNPVDIGPALPQTYLDIFEILLSADEVDGLLPLTSIWREFIIDVTIELVKMCRHYNKPAAIYTPNSVDKIISVKKKYHLPLFNSPGEAVRALWASYEHHRFIEKKEKQYEEYRDDHECPEDLIRV